MRMSEVEKMYENAGIKPLPTCNSCNRLDEYWSNGTYYCTCKDDKDNDECGIADYVYPTFTAEKQLELIKWLVKHRFNFMVYELTEKDFTFEVINERLKQTSQFVSLSENNFEEGLAKILNCFLQDLTEEERRQIKDILE